MLLIPAWQPWANQQLLWASVFSTAKMSFILPILPSGDEGLECSTSTITSPRQGLILLLPGLIALFPELLNVDFCADAMPCTPQPFLQPSV